MKQAEIKENSGSFESLKNASEKDSNPEENQSDLSPLAESETAENIPVESIGSYARIDELLDGERTERRGEADSES